ncbi:unnamed protein product [Brassica oleracea var. botrytis]
MSSLRHQNFSYLAVFPQIVSSSNKRPLNHTSLINICTVYIVFPRIVLSSNTTTLKSHLSDIYMYR